MATIEDQFAAIRDPDFVAQLQKRGNEITEALAGIDVGVIGGVEFHLSGITCMVELINNSPDCDISVGDDGHGGYLYKWRVPLAWLTDPQDNVIANAT